MITFDNFSFRYEERDKFTLKDLNHRQANLCD